jgi:hypothetical protein
MRNGNQADITMDKERVSGFFQIFYIRLEAILKNTLIVISQETRIS